MNILTNFMLYVARRLGKYPPPHPCKGICMDEKTWYLVLQSDAECGIERGDCVKWERMQESKEVSFLRPFVFLVLKKERKCKVADIVSLDTTHLFRLLVRPIYLKASK